MARVRARPLIAVLGVTLIVSALAGFALSRGDRTADAGGDAVRLDTPGMFDEPGAIADRAGHPGPQPA